MSRTCEICKVENGNVLSSMMVVRDYLTGRIALVKNQKCNPYTMAELDDLEDALGVIKGEIRIVEDNIKSMQHAEDEIPSGYSLARATDGKILLLVHFSEYHISGQWSLPQAIQYPSPGYEPSQRGVLWIHLLLRRGLRQGR